MPKLVPARGRSGIEIDRIAKRVLGDFQPEAIEEPQVVNVEFISICCIWCAIAVVLAV